MIYDYFATTPVVLPLVGALIALAVYRYYKEFFEAFVIGYSAFFFIINLAYLYLLYNGMKPLSYNFITLDAPGMVITTLVSFLGLLIMFYSFAYKDKPQYDSTYFVTYLILMGLMCGLANTYNVVVMLVFLEAATVFSGVLILFGRTKKAITATTIYLAISIFEVLLVLYGAFVLFNYTGSLDIASGIDKIPEGEKVVLALLFLFGFGTKAGILPLGLIWLPPAHSEAPPPISATMSGILVKASVIAMAKAMFPFYATSAVDTIILIVVVFGVLNMLIGVIMALLQEDLKKLLAYHTISQIGYILIGLGLATQLSVYGSLFHITNHMLFKGCLFLITGALILRVSTRKIHKMGGLLRQMPLTAISFLIASLAMSGFPFLNGAVSKAPIHEATTEAHLWVLYGIDVFGWAQYIGSVLTFICLIHAFYVIFMGKPKAEFAKVTDPPLYMLLPILIMAGLCVLIGIYPDLVSGVLQFAADALLHTGA